MFFSGSRHKDLIITIHGFGSKTSKEMDPLCAFLRKHHYEVVQFDYFNPKDPKDADFRQWIERTEHVIRTAIQHKRSIILIGFSMGGVIASYLASVYPVRGLILCAPAFFPFDASKAEQAGLSILRPNHSESQSSMTLEQNKAFANVVTRYRSSITQVDCPILILHGSDDEIINPRSSAKAMSMIHHEYSHKLGEVVS